MTGNSVEHGKNYSSPNALFTLSQVAVEQVVTVRGSWEAKRKIMYSTVHTKILDKASSQARTSTLTP